MPTLVLRQFLKDRRTLAEAMVGRWPTPEQLCRRALVGEWERSSALPDHVLRNRREAALGAATSEWDILRAVLAAYADEYLLRRDGEVHVHFDKFGQWQTEIADLSPLPFLAFALWRWYGAPDLGNAESVRNYVGQRLRPFTHTSLIGPFDPKVEDLIGSDGLHDRHIHLNGSTEVDKVWQDQLAHIARAAAELKQALPRLDRAATNDQSMLAELYEQLGLRPDAIYHHLRVARRLRMVLADYASGQEPTYRLDELVARYTIPALDVERRVREHPLARVAPERGKLIPELLLLITIFQRLESQPTAREPAKMLFLYLLILNGMAVPLTIQGERQKGFDQFQKFTFTGMRNPSEGKSYLDRFHQLNCSPRQDLAALEGRISPPDQIKKLRDLLTAILDGLNQYRGGGRIHSLADAAGLAPAPRPGEPRMELTLVAHFIKKKESSKAAASTSCRHQGLRLDLMKRWRVLREVRNTDSAARRFIVGIDAAANEMHAPPEAFAPLFRAARRAGMSHFTFHAGEDFEHLISGIRAVAEAVEFLGLRAGNRIGHGTALGIDPALWLERMPSSITMTKANHLDDLVFAYHHLLGCPSLGHFLAPLEGQIRELSRHLYGETHDPSKLYQAWTYRRLDPLAIRQLASGATTVDGDRQREILRLRTARDEDPAHYQLFCRHHEAEVRRRGATPIKVATGWLGQAALRHLQEAILQNLVSRQIAIETLPTSNVRISFYRDHGEHHVFRWLAEKPEQAPPICVGSDDPGIFANSMRAEFYHLAREAKWRGANWSEVDKTLRRLNDDSRVFGFRPAPADT